MYLFFSILLDTLFLLCDSKPCTHFNIYIYIYIYQDCYYILSPISSCVVSFLSLCICFLLIVSNLLYFSFTLRWCDEFCLKCFKNTSCQSLSCHELLSCEVFQEFVQGLDLLYSTSEYELSDLWLLTYVHLFVVFLSRIAKGGDC